MLNALLEDGIEPTFNDPTYQRKLAAAARLSGPERYLTYGKLDLDLARNAAPLVAFGNRRNLRLLLRPDRLPDRTASTASTWTRSAFGAAPIADASPNRSTAKRRDSGPIVSLSSRKCASGVEPVAYPIVTVSRRCVCSQDGLRGLSKQIALSLSS